MNQPVSTMTLLDIIHRTPDPEPWSEGEKIPWNDPSFSARMLNEHLSQAHDAASRRAEIIDRHVSWIHAHLLRGKPSNILDLGCGPGLYTSRLCVLGHTCAGIDFSPASIDYARQQAAAHQLTGEYTQADIRRADYGSGRDLVMLIFGEFNTFRPQDARLILQKACAALNPGGILLLEPHTFAAVRALGQSPNSWYSSESGLFADRPHLLLHDYHWNETLRVATERYFIIDAATGSVTRYASSMQAYSAVDYRELLAQTGFDAVEFYPLLGGDHDPQPGLTAITARRPGAESL